MKKSYFILVVAVACLISCNKESTQKDQTMLRHIVLFSFNDDLPSGEIKDIETAFVNLPSQIKEIKDFEWGTELNPKKEYSHCFVLSFESEKDMSAYGAHPAHKQFGEMVKGKTKAISIVDYWEK
ncbi:MAG: Dabb family protein [Tannerella sp.]|jgi:hypothetical protein|nr:Dabb family protein [Tannerella sp.]